MADNTHIEWSDATWNPITGCSVVSPGCTNCYAMRLAGTRLRNHPSRAGLTKPSKAGPVWTGEVRLNEQWLDQPLKWTRPRTIFVCAHGDLFHEDVPDEWIDKVFARMALARHHTFQVLTKRSARMRKYMADCEREARLMNAVAALFDSAPETMGRCYPIMGQREPWLPLPNVWLGVSAERQQEADERIPDLIETPADVHFLSLEPLLGPIDFSKVPGFNRVGLSLYRWWVIVGGESGHGARPMHPDWARSIRDQCRNAGVPFFFKQHGAWLTFPSSSPCIRTDGVSTFARVDGREYRGDNISTFPGNMRDDFAVRVGKKVAGRMLDGNEHNDMPSRDAGKAVAA